jgi:hypothetical protein
MSFGDSLASCDAEQVAVSIIPYAKPGILPRFAANGRGKAAPRLPHRRYAPDASAHPVPRRLSPPNLKRASPSAQAAFPFD